MGEKRKLTAYEKSRNEIIRCALKWSEAEQHSRSERIWESKLYKACRQFASVAR